MYVLVVLVFVLVLVVLVVSEVFNPRRRSSITDEHPLGLVHREVPTPTRPRP